MRLFQVFPIAFHSLATNKVRSFLAALGVVFGVGAVVAMLSISEGAKREAVEQVELLGSNTLFVDNSWESWDEGTGDGLSMRDAAALASLRAVSRWAPLRTYGSVAVQAERRKAVAEVIATTPEYQDILSLDVARGRFFDAEDFLRAEKVCVLGSALKRALFAFDEACGAHLKIGECWFTVVGVAEYKKIGSPRVSGLKIPHFNTQVFVPLGVADYFELDRRRGQRPSDTVDEIVVEVGAAALVEPVASVAERMLERLHGKGDAFKIVVPQALLAQSRRTQRTFNIVMGAIAGISLLVGGIGIMNIMLATVLERRHEIGVRRASGATTRAVLLQFLVEAVVLSLVGCIAGIILGAGLAYAVARYAGWRTAISPVHVIVAVAVAGMVGVLSGYYPARKAAGIDPGEALRYE